MPGEIQPKATENGQRSWWTQRRIFVFVCVGIIGGYVSMAEWGGADWWKRNAADAYYNLLVQGFRSGQLSVKKEVPPGFARLADPYDPNANNPYRSTVGGISDLSYYKGRMYLYFGVTPALVLFWPFVALTGHYLPDRQAVIIFSAVGITASLGLLRTLWRRYFSEVNIGVVVACGLALGLATGVPALWPQSDIYQVAISCGYMLTMLALGGLWCALHDTKRGWRWLAAASMAYGLAVGARATLLFGAIILLVPVVQAWGERRRRGTLLLAAVGPITLIGLGLMLYNFLRFDNPFEFGLRYELAGQRQLTLRFFSLHYFWFNFRVYLLEPARWSAHLPFVHEIGLPPMPAGYYATDEPFGILSNIPLVWFALAIPLAWRSWLGQTKSGLRWFVIAVVLIVGACMLPLMFYFCSALRYEVDFLPSLMLLAVMGILGLEHVLAGRPVRRCQARWGWGLLLAFSVAFNLLMSAVNWAYAGCALGGVLTVEGRVSEATQVLRKVLRIEPDYADGHIALADALLDAGQVGEAISHFEQALRINPDNAEAQNNWGSALERLDNVQDAVRHYEQALRIDPNYAGAHYNLGNALVRFGKQQEAISHYEQALRIKPDFAEAHYNWGIALMKQARLQEAIDHYEQALRIKPDFAEAHNNWGVALVKQGRLQEAIGHYEQALRIKPDYVDAHYNLGLALEIQARLQQAIGHYEQALRIRPDDAKAHYHWANALMKQGRLQEAIDHYEQALRIKPDFAEAHNELGAALAQTGRIQEAIAQFEQCLKMTADSGPTHHNLGLALAQAGRLQEAVAQFEQALQLQPDYADAHFHLGTTLARMGRTQEAIAHLEQALRIDPDFVEAENSLGINLARQGRIDEAFAHFDKALKLKPDYAEAHYNLATALEMAGRVPEAVQHYELALKLQPDFAAASNALARARAVR